jgi:hypothetical protein
MMMQATAFAATKTLVALMSPSKNSTRVRVAVPTLSKDVSVYRNDPYSWRVLASPVKALISPEHPAARPVAALPVESIVPQANRLLYSRVAATAAPAPLAETTAHANIAATVKPAATSAVATSSVRYAFVNFKHEGCTYVAPFKVSVGDVVIVEGDRGEDIGVVSEISAEKPSFNVPCKILRRASRKDLELRDAKKVREAQAEKLCQDLAETLSLSIEIVDVEFQFDYNKLTVYFESRHHHIDFRKLQRSLFREYRCRIWLANVAEVEAAKAQPRTR